MSAASCEGWSLLYVADPLCSWCYGFAPSLAAARRRWPTLGIDLLLGGLRPQGEVLDDRLRASIRHHWLQVAERSGQAFSPAGLAREGWLYTTEPACRAVVVARTQGAEPALALFGAIQTAFYARGEDTTDPRVLGRLAREAGLDGPRFETLFAGEEGLDATRNDFATAQRLGIRGFPTLLAVRGTQRQAVAAGWMSPAALLDALDRVFGA